MIKVSQLRLTGKVRRIARLLSILVSAKTQTHFLQLFSGIARKAAVSANVHHLPTTNQASATHKRTKGHSRAPIFKKKVAANLRARLTRWLLCTAVRPASCAEMMFRHQSTFTLVVVVMSLIAMNASSKMVTRTTLGTPQRAQNLQQPQLKNQPHLQCQQLQLPPKKLPLLLRQPLLRTAVEAAAAAAAAAAVVM